MNTFIARSVFTTLMTKGVIVDSSFHSAYTEIRIRNIMYAFSNQRKVASRLKDGCLSALLSFVNLLSTLRYREGSVRKDASGNNLTNKCTIYSNLEHVRFL